MSDVDVDEGTDLSGADDSAEFLDFLGEEVGGDPNEQIADDDDDDGSVEGDDSEDEPENAARVANKKDEEQDEEPARNKGRERLASKLAAKEREVTNLNRRLKELEAKVAGGNEDRQAEPDLFDDRVSWVRSQLARGMGLRPDHPRVAEELQELIDDAVLRDLSPEMLNDPKNEHLRRQVEERKRNATTRREQAALDRRMAEIERREAEASRAQQEAGIRSQLTGYVGSRAAELPYLQANPDADPVDLIYQGLMIRWEGGEDLRSAEAAQAAVQDITDRLEAHYAGVAERLSEVRERLRSAATDLKSGGAERQGGAAKTKRRTGGTTVTSANGTGGRGAAPTTRATDDDESFDEFLHRGLSERARTARRRR